MISPPGLGGIEGKLERFIVEELLDELHGGRDPLATGAVDSLGLEQLVAYIEEEFGVGFDDADMVEQSFASVATLAALVESKLAGGAMSRGREP